MASMSYGGWCSKSDYNDFKNSFNDNQIEWTPVIRSSELNPSEGPKHIISPRCTVSAGTLSPNTLFTFGKYKGNDINTVYELDSNYIKWVSIWITEDIYGKLFYDSIIKFPAINFKLKIKFI